jgi:hypothetical protein
MKHDQRYRHHTLADNVHIAAKIAPGRKYFLMLAFALSEIERCKLLLAEERFEC